MKTADIDDEQFMAAVREVMRLRGLMSLGASRWDVAAVLAGHPEDVGGACDGYPNFPEKIILAKARRLIRRGRLTGCCCGCRGDFEPVEIGAV